MARSATALKDKAPPDEADSKPADPFIALVKEALTKLMNTSLEPKDMNATIANAIKLIAIEAKFSGEGEEDSFFGS
jgi:hypothetical protein